MKKVEQWRSWLAEHGETAKLHFPLKPLTQSEIGHTIVVAYAQGRVYVIDQEGKEILNLESQLSGPWGAEFLPDGHYLVNYYGSAAAVEYDARGKELWRFQPGNLNSTWCAQRLPNGNTLVTHGQTALEVDAKGQRVWEKQFEANLCQAIRLENGNTLVATTASPGRVIEVDPSGKEVFEIKGTLTAYRLQRLDSGNTLLTEKGAGRVREFDPSGKMVWEHAIPNPDGAQRIANGNTIIGNSQGLHEVTPKGQVVWQHEVSGQTLFFRY
jgi:outer membrane protein assembly factor BamB